MASQVRSRSSSISRTCDVTDCASFAILGRVGLTGRASRPIAHPDTGDDSVLGQPDRTRQSASAELELGGPRFWPFPDEVHSQDPRHGYLPRSGGVPDGELGHGDVGTSGRGEEGKRDVRSLGVLGGRWGRGDVGDLRMLVSPCAGDDVESGARPPSR